MEKDVLMFSGGLDSLIAWFYLDKPKCVYCALGHKYQHKEFEAIDKLVDELAIWGEEMEVTVDKSLQLYDIEEEDANIPMRNSFLAHIGALYGDNIWLIVQKGETNIPDRTMNFFNNVTHLLRDLNENNEIEVDSPFWDMTKADMVNWYVEEGFPIGLLLKSSSCYSRMVGEHCGECSACFRRWVALSLNDIEEDYKVNPWETELAEEYLEKAHNGYYVEQRNEEIIRALRRKEVD